MGTPDFAVPSLEMLVQNNYTISVVVTAPDKPRGRGQQVSYTPVKEFAIQNSIPVLQPDSLNDPQFISDLTAIHADLFIIVAFKILPKEVYTLPSNGSFNLHASLLPKFRGAAPINWAIINGEKESGVTTFFLQEKVDTGNIIMQHRIPISDEMNAGELHDALSVLGASAVIETVRMIESGSAAPQQQNDSSASPAPKLFKGNTRINWNQPSEKIHNFIRGLSPYPAAWTQHNQKAIKIFKSCLEQSPQQLTVPSGAIIADEKKLFVTTIDGNLEILELQQEGKKRLSAEEFLRGYTFSQADRFE